MAPARPPRVLGAVDDAGDDADAEPAPPLRRTSAASSDAADPELRTWSSDTPDVGRWGAASTAGSYHTGARKVNQDAVSWYVGGPRSAPPARTAAAARTGAPTGAPTGALTGAVVAAVAVCDGHGDAGEVVSSLVRRLAVAHLLSARALVPQAAEHAFAAAAREVKEELGRVAAFSGCTCVAAALREDGVLVVCNVGDSRAVGCAPGRGGREPVSVALSHDHKPDRPDELERIQRAGGVVTRGRGDVPRVAGLALSRAFGDAAAEPHGVTAQPEVLVTSASEFDFVVLASDGVWDVMDSEEVVAFVRARLLRADAPGPEPPAAVAAELVARCRARWIADTGAQYADDVTACVWDLRALRRPERAKL